MRWQVVEIRGAEWQKGPDPAGADVASPRLVRVAGPEIIPVCGGYEPGPPRGSAHPLAGHDIQRASVKLSKSMQGR